jgi:hypothetical protein
MKKLLDKPVFNKIMNNPVIDSMINDPKINFFIKTTLVVIVMGLIFYGFKKFIFYLLSLKNDSPWIVKNNKNAKNSLVITQDPSNENSITLYRSDNQQSGIQFSYVFWMVIENMEYKFGEWKHVFHKGNKTSYPNRAPGVFIHPEKNALRFYMNTYKNILEYIDIDNIPLKRWVHVGLVLDHKYLDVYINGYLRKRHELSSLPKQNFGDLWLNLYGGFEGYLSKLRYYRRALKYYEIESIVTKGPSNQACSGGELPPYLDDNWWFDI